MSQVIESIPSTPIAPVFQSRWGYHPCSREDFAMLKRLNRLAERAKRLAYAQWRWDRKTVNRGVRRERQTVGYKPLLTKWVRHENAVARPDAPLEWKKVYPWDTGGRRTGRGFWLKTDADLFMAMYRRARQPSPMPRDDFDFAPSVLSAARAMLVRLEAWEAARDAR